MPNLSTPCVHMAAQTHAALNLDSLYLDSSSAACLEKTTSERLSIRYSVQPNVKGFETSYGFTSHGNNDKDIF